VTCGGYRQKLGEAFDNGDQDALKKGHGK
jgi:hypothetical protein